MATYILVDSLNMFFRSSHVAGGKDINMRVGMSLHIMMHSIKKAFNDFSGSHVVFFKEGRSWRKDHTATYKANRAAAAAQRTPREVEDDELFFEGYGALIDFIEHKTNCSVVHCPVAEADDLIATWIHMHPNDQHVVISSDSDFIQLLAPNVVVYNGVTNLIFYHDRVTNEKGQTLSFTIESSGKIKVGKPDPNFKPDPDWVQYALFVKCVRGDSSDNVFSAFPGAPIKSTKNRVGIREAYLDRERAGYAYTNFMLQRWTDHNGVEHRVKDAFERNCTLIDLKRIPDEIAAQCQAAITSTVNKPQVNGVGWHFMKFCGQWQLVKLSESATELGVILNRGIV